jgi:hypothetical protein
MSGKNDENKTNIAVNKVLCNPVRTQLLDCKTNTQNIEVRFVLHFIVLVLQS